LHLFHWRWLTRAVRCGGISPRVPPLPPLHLQAQAWERHADVIFFVFVFISCHIHYLDIPDINYDSGKEKKNSKKLIRAERRTKVSAQAQVS
jgi:hypothetical protein